MQDGSTDQESQATESDGKLLSVRLRPAAKKHLDRYALQVQAETGRRIPLSRVLEELILSTPLKQQIQIPSAPDPK